MAEPSTTLYDNHDDNSVNTSLWTTVTHGNGAVTEAGSSYLNVSAPGTGSGGNQDKDRALISQDTAGEHGMQALIQYDLGSTFNYVSLGITDTPTTAEGTGWNGNYIRILIGSYANPISLEATISVSGYTILENNGPIAVSENTNITVKIYENGDDTTIVDINGSVLAIIDGDVVANSKTQYEARSATDALRHATLRVYNSYDYAANPLTTASAETGYAFLMEIAALALSVLSVGKILVKMIWYNIANPRMGSLKY